MDLAQEKGASSWLTAFPIREFSFCLHKSAFSDALAVRYGWPPKKTPTKCTCGKSFTVEHALLCQRGRLSIIRHNEIRDLTASPLTKVCHDMKVWNLTYNPLPVNKSLDLPPTLTTVPGWTLLPTDFGVV